MFYIFTFICSLFDYCPRKDTDEFGNEDIIINKNYYYNDYNEIQNITPLTTPIQDDLNNNDTFVSLNTSSSLDDDEILHIQEILDNVSFTKCYNIIVENLLPILTKLDDEDVVNMEDDNDDDVEVSSIKSEEQEPEPEPEPPKVKRVVKTVSAKKK